MPKKNKGKPRFAGIVTPTVTPGSKKLESTEPIHAAAIGDEKPGDSSLVPVSETSLVELVGIWAAMTPTQKKELMVLARRMTTAKSAL